jgi:hypothetical protein
MRRDDSNQPDNRPDAESRLVDVRAFDEILEGKRVCPTLAELGSLAERARRDAPAPDDEQTHAHMRECKDCDEFFRMIELVVQAGDEAISRVCRLP